MITETSIVKAGQQDIVNYLFYAQDLNGNFQVAHSGAFFGDPNNLETSQADAALHDLTAKLQALGWQQVGGASPWYSLTFQRQAPGTASATTSTIKALPLDPFFKYQFGAEDQNGKQVAVSDKTFNNDPGLQTPDEKAALDDLTAKLQALGWRQVVGTVPDPWYSLTFQLVVYTSNSTVKPLQQVAAQNRFYAEDQNGKQVAQSGVTFSGEADIETPQAQAALNDLLVQLQTLGWQQVTVGVPTPWYSYQFTKAVPFTS